MRRKDRATPGLVDGTHLRVHPSAGLEEITAVVLVLDAAAAGPVATRRRAPRPAWQEAARREAVRSRPLVSSVDVRVAATGAWS